MLLARGWVRTLACAWPGVSPAPAPGATLLSPLPSISSLAAAHKSCLQNMALGGKLAPH